MLGTLFAVEQAMLVKIIILSVILAVCAVVLVIAIVMFVKEDKRAAAEQQETPAGDNNEASAEETPEEATEEATEEVADEAPAEEAKEEETPVAAEETTEEQAEEAPVAEAAEETPAEEEQAPAEEAPAEAAVEETPAEDETVAAVAVADDEEEDEVVEIPVDVATEGKEVPAFMNEIFAELSEPSRALLSSYVVERRFNRMKEIYEYPDEKAFLGDFFNNSVRFKSVLNAEIYTVLYERAKKGKRTEQLSKLRLKYANALYRYSKSDPSLLPRVIELLKDDVKYYFDVVNARDTKVQSVKKLIVVYTAAGKYQDALDLIDSAIERNLYDVRKTGYANRRKKVEAMMK